MLEQAEGENLAKAIAEVQALYGQTLDPKQEAWAKLILVAGAVYGRRGFAIYMRTQQEKQMRLRPPPSAVPSAASDFVPEQPPLENGFDPQQPLQFDVQDDVPPPRSTAKVKQL